MSSSLYFVSFVTASTLKVQLSLSCSHSYFDLILSDALARSVDLDPCVTLLAKKIEVPLLPWGPEVILIARIVDWIHYRGIGSEVKDITYLFSVMDGGKSLVPLRKSTVCSGANFIT